jgi:hypothetical protein
MFGDRSRKIREALEYRSYNMSVRYSSVGVHFT